MILAMPFLKVVHFFIVYMQTEKPEDKRRKHRHLEFGNDTDITEEFQQEIQEIEEELDIDPPKVNTLKIKVLW